MATLTSATTANITTTATASASATTKKICVVGGGIMGLSSSLLLAAQLNEINGLNFTIEIISEKWSPHITSAGVGGKDYHFIPVCFCFFDCDNDRFVGRLEI